MYRPMLWTRSRKSQPSRLVQCAGLTALIGLMVLLRYALDKP